MLRSCGRQGRFRRALAIAAVLCCLSASTLGSLRHAHHALVQSGGSPALGLTASYAPPCAESPPHCAACDWRMASVALAPGRATPPPSAPEPRRAVTPGLACVIDLPTASSPRAPPIA